jgi:hypothetical protein
MAEFVLLTNWLREGEPPPAEPPVVEATVAVEIDVEIEEPSLPPEEDVLLDDVCARLRRFRAMLDDAFDYVQERDEPTTPLTIRVHPTLLAAAERIGLPLAGDERLREEDAVIELHCGSLDAQLLVPLARLLVPNDR